jgi:hypothetical protein
MRSKLILLAAVCVAALALSADARAATILQFAQTSSLDTVVASVSGSTTTLSTNSATFPGSIPIRITQEGNVTPPGGSLAAFETFLPALTSTTGSAGPPPLQNGFNGTIIFSTGPNGTGGNILTVVVTNGRLSANGNAGGFDASSGTTNGGNPTTVTLTSSDPNIAPLLSPAGGPSQGAVSLALINITPAQTGAGFTSFLAQNAGNVSTLAAPIPEPASVLSAGTAILVGLGCFGWSRRKSLKA